MDPIINFPDVCRFKTPSERDNRSIKNNKQNPKFKIKKSNNLLLVTLDEESTSLGNYLSRRLDSLSVLEISPTRNNLPVYLYNPKLYPKADEYEIEFDSFEIIRKDAVNFVDICFYLFPIENQPTGGEINFDFKNCSTIFQHRIHNTMGFSQPTLTTIARAPEEILRHAENRDMIIVFKEKIKKVRITFTPLPTSSSLLSSTIRSIEEFKILADKCLYFKIPSQIQMNCDQVIIKIENLLNKKAIVEWIFKYVSVADVVGVDNEDQILDNLPSPIDWDNIDLNEMDTDGVRVASSSSACSSSLESTESPRQQELQNLSKNNNYIITTKQQNRFFKIIWSLFDKFS